jgi:hypothetical protein
MRSLLGFYRGHQIREGEGSRRSQPPIFKGITPSFRSTLCLLAGRKEGQMSCDEAFDLHYSAEGG